MVYTPSMGLTRTLILLSAYSSSFIIGKTKTCWTLLSRSNYKPMLTVCSGNNFPFGWKSSLHCSAEVVYFRVFLKWKCGSLLIYMCFISVFKGGFLLAKPMRERNCMTVLDPFHQKYGKALTAAMSLVSLCLDMFWVPATLTGLGLLFTCVHRCS